MKLYTLDELIEIFKDIKAKGWVENARQGNVGGVGNTIEDFYGIEENNLPVANSAEWELKCGEVVIMTEPCYTCTAVSGGDFVCRLFCRLFDCDTLEATELYCHGHRYHLPLIVYKEMVFMRDTTNASK